MSSTVGRVNTLIVRPTCISVYANPHGPPKQACQHDDRGHGMQLIEDLASRCVLRLQLGGPNPRSPVPGFLSSACGDGRHLACTNAVSER